MILPRAVWPLWIAVALPLAGWCADPARDALEEGTRQYERGSFGAAAGEFEQAAQDAPKAHLDAAVPRYNQGNALIKAKRPDDASKAYADALRSTDLALQGKAYFNRGNALVQMSAAEEAKGEMDMAGRALDEALLMYENSMALDSRDEDAKVNYELALKQKEQLEQKQKQQSQQQKQDQQQQQQQQQNKDEQQQPQYGQDQQNQQEQQQQAQPQQQEQASQQQPQAPKSSEAMTPEEATMVLDSMRQEEQAKREQMKLIIGQPMPVEKDW